MLCADLRRAWLWPPILLFLWKIAQTELKELYDYVKPLKPTCGIPLKGRKSNQDMVCKAFSTQDTGPIVGCECVVRFLHILAQSLSTLCKRATKVCKSAKNRSFRGRCTMARYSATFTSSVIFWTQQSWFYRPCQDLLLSSCPTIVTALDRCDPNRSLSQPAHPELCNRHCPNSWQER